MGHKKGTLFNKVCGYCHGKFQALGTRVTHCSARCYLLGKSVVDASGCRLWTGGGLVSGYGEVAIQGVRHRTHRLSYETFVGPVPDGYYVCHRCDVPACISPEHLFLGTVLENTRDSVVKRRNRRKLTEDEVGRIRTELTTSVRGMARELGVSAALVSYIRQGRAWKHLLPGNINFQKSD